MTVHRLIHGLCTDLPQVLNSVINRFVLALGPWVGRMSEPPMSGPLRQASIVRPVW